MYSFKITNDELQSLIICCAQSLMSLCGHGNADEERSLIINRLVELNNEIAERKKGTN